MVIKKINAISCAKIAGLLYAIIGLLLGGCFALISLAGGFAAAGRSAAPFAFLGMGSIIVFPLIYGVIGFIFTWIAAMIYNVLAGVVGGIEVEVAPVPGSNWGALAGTSVPSI